MYIFTTLEKELIDSGEAVYIDGRVGCVGCRGGDKSERAYDFALGIVFYRCSGQAKYDVAS